MKFKTNKKRLVLLDAHAIIHRAYHALPDFQNAAGEPTGALYGVVTMLIKIIEELSPDYIVACFDLPEKTHRHIAYEEYKGKSLMIISPSSLNEPRIFLLHGESLFTRCLVSKRTTF
jgi:5'-3' exonuclease